MRLMAHDSCRPGDVVADSVRGPQGEVLIEKGTALTPLLLEQCAALRIDILPIEWLGWDSIRPSWWVSEGIMERCRAWVSSGLAGLDAEGLITARRVTSELLAILPPEDQRPFEAMPRYQVGSPAAAAWINTVGLTIKLAAGLDWKRVEDYALAAVILGLEFGIPAGRVQIPESCRLDPVITAIRTRSAVPADHTSRDRPTSCALGWLGRSPVEGRPNFSGRANCGPGGSREYLSARPRR